MGKGLAIVPAFDQGAIETEAITPLLAFIRSLREVGRTRRAPITDRLTRTVKPRDHPAALPFGMHGDNLWNTRVSDTRPPEPTAGGTGHPDHP